MKCYFIRHSITEANAKKLFNGCGVDDPLSEEGKELIRPIDDTDINAPLFCSPMKRALETAAIMLPLHEPRIIDELREMDFGRLEGKNHEMLKDDSEYQAWLDSGGIDGVPGGESLEEFGQRVLTGFRKALSISASDGTDTIYLVAHGGTIMVLMCALTGRDYYEFKLPNGAGYEIDLEVDDAGNVVAAASYDRFCGGLRNGSSDWRPPQYTTSDQVDR